MKKRILFAILCFSILSFMMVKNVSAATTTNQTWQGTKFTSNETLELGNAATVTLRKLTESELSSRGRNANFVIPNGVTVTLKGSGTFGRASDNLQSLIYVEQGGKLIIEGKSDAEPLIIDGKNVIANTPLIYSEGTVEMKYTVIQNGKNRSVDADGKPNGSGGGIRITSPGSLAMNHCIISRNTASVNGGGIYSTGKINILNSTISKNVAASTETGTPRVDAGRGGGFFLNGSGASGVFKNVIVEDNTVMYYGGGGQVSNGAEFTMEEGTVFRKNKAILHGAGALHLTGDAKFVMNGGSMEENFGQYVGGAIHSSYSCKLELNKGEIKNNISNGRGGGIHINTGGAITLNENIIISGNKVYKQSIGTSAKVDSTGDKISNVLYEGTDTDFGYGGGVLIDSGTCTVAGATIEDNFAEIGGGGIALTMLNMGEGGLDDYMVINFSMTAGKIINNQTNGNGAGVYIMTNKAEENLKKSFPVNAEKNYEWALEQIDKTNKHGFTADDIINGIPKAIVSGGTISNNTAQDNGGGLFLGEKTKFLINGGSLSNNSADDGAGAYIASGDAEINGGTMSENKASANGGAIYVSGTVTMTDGTIDSNEAAGNGGALYVSQGDFEMISGSITNNKATGSVSDGGGAYVIGGNIVIGVNGCSGEGDKHSVEAYRDKIHPLIVDNEAVNCGGGLAVMGNGNITMYCGKIINNKAINRGRGLNIYMQSGQFDYYSESADVGETTEPELVIVGGKLVDHELQSEGNGETTLNYYHCNKNEGDCDHEVDYPVKEAKATTDSYINLPDGEYYWDAAEGTRFFGWTFYGPNDEEAKANVRTKDDYKAMGLPIQVTDMTDGRQDNAVNMYALWAPVRSKITYVGSVIAGTYTSETLNLNSAPSHYSLNETSYDLAIPIPVKDGYTFLGWYIYQDLNQNANWGYEPLYKDNSSTAYDNLDFNALESSQFLSVNGDENFELSIDAMTFGDITLIAKFEPAYTDLEIKKDVTGSMNDNQSFLFQISGTPDDKKLDAINMTVVINGEGIATIKHLPVGSYTVTEVTTWSQQFTNVKVTHQSNTIESKKIDLLLNNPEVTERITFTNNRPIEKWLIGDCYCENWWNQNKVMKR